MSRLVSRRAIIPVWVVVFGLVAWFGPPLTLAMGLLLLITGGGALAVMLVLWKTHAPTVDEVRHQVAPRLGPST